MIVALSTWTLDPIVKARYPDTPGIPPQGRYAIGPDDGIEAWEIPAAAKARGFDLLEYPHFHLPHQSVGREAVAVSAAEAGVALGTLLIDDGDAADARTGLRDEAWIARWIVIAGEMGFARARFLPGRAHPDRDGADPGTFERGLEATVRLADVAERAGVRPLVENWFGLMDSPERVIEVLDALGGRVGLCADFGNWVPPLRDELPRILPRAETIHAKAEFDAEGYLDETLLKAQVDQAVAAGFDGPYVIVAGGPDDVWTGATRTAALIRRYAT